MEKKITKAKELILAHQNAPVVLSSFGKDSLVLLELIKECNLKYPVISFREPHMRWKYDFAEKEIRERELTVYDYPPLAAGLVKLGDSFEVINFHQCGPLAGDYLALPTGIVPPSDGSYLCAKQDLLSKPTGWFNFPWKTLLIGHKASDVDPLWGEVSITEPVRKVNGKTYIYPLIDFTHQDVVDFFRSRELRIHIERYNPATLLEWPDKRDNPDYFPACTACIDYAREAEVFCPKTQKMILNCADTMPYLKPELPAYIGRK